jgi:hypothetical protein
MIDAKYDHSGKCQKYLMRLDCMLKNHLENQTINDFGEQWSVYSDNKGWYGSFELFKDIITPLLAPDSMQGKIVAEIGSGTGRIVNMLIAS